MDFELSPEQRGIKATFARFSDEKIAPHAAAIDAAHAFPREVFDQLAAMGLFGMRYPEADGGTGLALMEFCLIPLPTKASAPLPRPAASAPERFGPKQVAAPTHLERWPTRAPR